MGAAALALLLGAAGVAAAQVAPHAPWRTIRTAHFRIHFTPELELQARRAAANAEWAWERLARELPPPRGPVDIVLSDDVDYTNGFATPFPTNRIVLYAHPPVDVPSLRFYDDWNALLVAHELAHIFQLDRVAGWWRVAQWVFGRNPALFPNQYTPAWLTEGIAVYYESRLTGAGRVLGSEHRMIARAAALESATPRLDEWSLASPDFPGGQSAYAYGSLLLDYIARTEGPGAVPRLIARLSGAAIPFRLDAAARAAFGETFTAKWRAWRDSVRRDLPGIAPPLDGWTPLTRAEWYALYPRWSSRGSIVYSASTGKETPGAYEVGLDGRARRLGRRNSLEPNAPMPDGSILFTQLDFVDAYHVRGDLWIERDGEQRPLTRGARLAQADARETDGEVVAVQAVPATTRLVRVSPRTGAVVPLTAVAPDTQWSEPRWSPDGTLIAAVRAVGGAVTEIAVLDTAGVVRHVLARDRAVNAAPAWAADGRALYYTSDRHGVTNIFRVTVPAPGDTVAPLTVQVGDAATGVFQPAPRDSLVAAAHYRAQGYEIGVGRPAPLLEGPGITIAADTAGELIPAGAVRAPAAGYSPWRLLVPRYWLPVVQSTGEGRTLFGAFTSAQDVVGRHAWAAQAAVAPEGDAVDAWGSYRWAGLGQPVLALSGAWTRRAPLDFAFRSGFRFRYVSEERSAALAATVVRPRFRSYAWASLGTELEWFGHELEPASARDSLVLPGWRRSVGLSGGWSNVQRPPLSVSPEDGVALSGSARRRWTDTRTPYTVALGQASGYAAFDWWGYAHHVLAARVAAGWTDADAGTDFDVGGVSGSTLPIAGAFDLGDARRSFPVRGFAPGARAGARALGGSVEWRAPLALAGRGIGLVPLFLQRTSLTAFADAAAAWCPSATARGACAFADTSREWLASVGGELGVDAAIFAYDYPYRFRLGVAVPVAGTPVVGGRDDVTAFFSLGLSF